jgi:Protein of unknown function (DUF1761)
MVPEINIWAVLVATLSSLVVGSVWYARPVFGNWWMKAARVEPTGRSVIYPILSTLVVSLITASVLAGASAIAQHFYKGNFLLCAVLTALVMWAGFTAARVITHDAFEGRPKLLTLLTISHELVTLVIMGLVIGLFGFPGA